MTTESYLKAADLIRKIDFYKERLDIWKCVTDATVPKICLDGNTVDIESFLPFGELRSKAIAFYKYRLEECQDEFNNL